jgi:multiple sugar transport system substrate-binding protein
MFSERPLKREEVLKYGLAGGTALVAGGLAGPLRELAHAATAPSGTITTWSPDTRPAAISSEQWLDAAFHKAYPKAKVNRQTVPYGQDNVKFQAGQATGIVPDIIWAYSDFLYSYGEQGWVIDVNDVANAVGPKRFSVLQDLRVGKHLYTIPFVGFPFFVYYRKDVYAKKGLKPPKTFGQFLSNIQKSHDPPNTYGYVLTNQSISDTWNLKTAMWTHGAYYFDKNDQLALNRPQTLQSWNWYKQLGKYSPPGSMAQQDLDARQLIVDGKVAHMLTTTSLAANFTPDNIQNFGAFLYPSLPGAKGASIDMYGMCIPKKAKNPQTAKAYIEFLLKPANFQQYLARTVIGWVPMLGDAYTSQYLNNPRIKPVQEFVHIGQLSAKTGVEGTGYFGPSKHAAALTSTNVEKQIGDRLVIQNQDARSVLSWAEATIKAAM